MSSSTMGVAGVLLIVYAIAIFVLYHKLFAVVYFDLAKGIGQEIIWSLIGSIILTALTIYLYWVVAIIVAVAGLILSAKVEDKSKKTTVIVVFLILAAIVFFMGGKMKRELSDNDKSTDTYEDTYYEDEDDAEHYEEDEYEDAVDSGAYESDSYTDEDAQEVVEEEQETEEDVNVYEETNGYILPNSDQVVLTEADLEGLSAQELTYARNEIYARHGYIFKSSELNDYFGQQDWYVADESFSGTLEGIEQQNATFISDYQTQNGLEYRPQ